jgi:hypothetical protein
MMKGVRSFPGESVLAPGVLDMFIIAALSERVTGMTPSSCVWERIRKEICTGGTQRPADDKVSITSVLALVWLRIRSATAGG